MPYTSVVRSRPRTVTDGGNEVALDPASKVDEYAGFLFMNTTFSVIAMLRTKTVARGVLISHGDLGIEQSESRPVFPAV